MHDSPKALPLCLLTLRITVFLVMAVWTLDKFVNPAHAAAVFANFYWISDLSPQAMNTLGALETTVLLAFLLGLGKTWSYGIILSLHAISTLSSFQQYMSPFEGAHLLFFAAWPMLAACFTLFLLREHDALLVWPRPGKHPPPK